MMEKEIEILNNFINKKDDVMEADEIKAMVKVLIEIYQNTEPIDLDLLDIQTTGEKCEEYVRHSTLNTELEELREYKKIAELTKISCCTAQNCEALNNAIKLGLENDKLKYELENAISKTKIKEIKSKYKEKYKEHKAVVDKIFEEVGTDICSEKELMLKELGAIEVCEEILEV